MSDNIKRQKIMERERFTYEEKKRFSKKSDDKCCHCGRKVFFNYGATVEHFIPLSQGGTNREINMVMLCEECNKEKGNFIYNPKDYLTYIKPEYLEQIQGYFDSYIQSFDFINRDNLLACDRYKVNVPLAPDNVFNAMVKKSLKKNKDFLKKQYASMWVKRATMDDLDRITEYYIKYLKKYDCLDEEYAAKVNIEFWLTFGCIYYIENKNKDIEMFLTVTVTKSDNGVTYTEEEIKNLLTINIFAYYNNDRAFTLAYNFSKQIPKTIIKEQNLAYLPIKYNVLKNDSINSVICENGRVYDDGRFLASFVITYCNSYDLDYIDVDDANVEKFFSKFTKLNEGYLEKWFERHDKEVYDWMLREIEL